MILDKQRGYNGNPKHLLGKIYGKYCSCARTRNIGLGTEISSGLRPVPENFEILEFFGILERIGKELATRINNSLNLTRSTMSKGRRSRTIIRAIPSVISIGLTIFRVSFCTCDRHFISIQFLF